MLNGRTSRVRKRPAASNQVLPEVMPLDILLKEEMNTCKVVHTNNQSIIPFRYTLRLVLPRYPLPQSAESLSFRGHANTVNYKLFCCIQSLVSKGKRVADQFPGGGQVIFYNNALSYLDRDW